MQTLPPKIFENLIRDVQSGSEEAAVLLFERCRKPLLAIIRELLSFPLRKLYDSDDFLLETYAVILTHRFTEEVLGSPQTLWTYLQRIAQNKVRDAQREYVLTRRHDLRREVPLDNLHFEGEAVSSSEFSPEEAMMLTDLVEERLNHLVAQLPVLQRGILRLLLRGHNSSEIARILNLKPYLVYRAVEWLKEKVVE